MTNAIIAINAGSTSLKFAAYAVDASGSPPLLCRGQIDGMQDDPHFVAKNPAGKPLDAHEWGEGHAIDLLGLRVTLKQLSGTDPGATGSVRKLLGMEHAQQVADLCLEMSGPSGALGGRGGAGVTGAGLTGAGAPGGDGTPDGAHWARQMLMTQALTIGGGTTDIQLNIIGERMLGLPRDPEPPTR